MKTDLPELIVNFVDLATQYGLITDCDGRILHCNPLLQNVLKIQVNSLDEIFGTSASKIQSLICQADTSKKMLSFDNEIDFGDGISQIFGNVYPLEDGQKHFIVMLFHPVDTLHRLEETLFDQKSGLLTDNRWVLNESFETIKFTADLDSIFYGRKPGFSIFEAVAEKDHNIVMRAFDKARILPGELVEITIDAHRQHGICQIEASIIYAPDMFYGNRYFVMTRQAVHRAIAILDRMAEAYQVSQDKDLAHRLHITAPAISNIRISQRQVPAAWLLRCWLDCNVHFYWIYTGLGEKFFTKKFPLN